MQSSKRFVYEPSGPHRVGAFDLLTDHGSAGVLARIFYPTSDPVGHGWAYTEPEYVHGLLDFLRWSRWLRGFFGWAANRLRLCCAWRGALLEQQQQLPLIVFSHGLGGQRFLYSALCLDLASHGFVVAAVEHRDGSASGSFFGGSSGRVWLPYEQHLLSDFPFRNRQVQQRTDEVQQLTDVMLRLHSGQEVANFMPGLDDNSAESGRLMRQFQGRIDTSRIHVMGHSFGGATALTAAVTGQNGLYKTCCLHDVWMHPVDPEHYSQLQVPVLFLNNQHFHWETNVKRIRQVLDAPGLTPDMATVLTIRGTNHSAQSDAGLYTSPWLAKRMGLTHAMDAHEAIRLSSRASRLFIARHEGRKITEAEEKLLNGEDPVCFADFTFEADTPRHS